MRTPWLDLQENSDICRLMIIQPHGGGGVTQTQRPWKVPKDSGSPWKRQRQSQQQAGPLEEGAGEETGAAPPGDGEAGGRAPTSSACPPEQVRHRPAPPQADPAHRSDGEHQRDAGANGCFRPWLTRVFSRSLLFPFRGTLQRRLQNCVPCRVFRIAS